MEVPVIVVDECSNHKYNAINNNSDPLKVPSNVIGDVNTPITKWGREILSERRRKNGSTTFQYSSNTYTLKVSENNDSGDFIVKRVRKNGLGLPCGFSRLTLDSMNDSSPLLPPRLPRSAVKNTHPSPELSRHKRLLSPDISRRSPELVTRLSPEPFRSRSPNRMSPKKFPGSPESIRRLSSGKFGQHLASPEDNELEQVKQTTARLKLVTRRPSFVAWHAMYIDHPMFTGRPYTIHEAEEAGSLTEARRNKVNSSLDWIKTELMEMRSQDKELARQLLSLRKQMNTFKLEKSCQEHEDLLEDAHDQIEELQELSDMCDLPLEEFGFSRTPAPLKHIGVTRLNLSARRFSTC